MNIRKVAVLGTGTMGNQIAVLATVNGYIAVGYDISDTAIKKAEEFSKSWFKSRIDKGKMCIYEAEEIQSRLTFTTDIQTACEKADLVIEAVADVLEIKKKAFAEASRFTPDHTIFASNSSFLVSSKFCDAVKDPSKMCNLHFFNPALVMKTVEIVGGDHTSAETTDTIFEFSKTLGKDPVVVGKEIYGFIVNRILMALLKESCYLADMGIASFEDIDRAVKGALGHPMGPFELMDLGGVDLEYSVRLERFKDTGDVAERPAICLTEKVVKGEFGRKSGKGFYEYDKA
jgi:3-hydroxybutyryl-CoA dehydrogenase